jgi:hypothetical protein
LDLAGLEAVDDVLALVGLGIGVDVRSRYASVDEIGDHDLAMGDVDGEYQRRPVDAFSVHVAMMSPIKAFVFIAIRKILLDVNHRVSFTPEIACSIASLPGQKARAGVRNPCSVSHSTVGPRTKFVKYFPRSGRNGVADQPDEWNPVPCSPSA